MTAPTTGRRPTPVSPVPPDLFDAAGPVVSVYLTTEGALPRAGEQVALRWKTLRAQLADDGAPPAALTALDPVVDGSHAAGQTLVALANRDGVLYRAHLPELPDRDLAVVGPLPHLVPLLAATQRLLPHLVVVIDRVGAELIAVLPEQDDRHATVDGQDLHVTRSAPGGWSQRRFQQRAENRWEANAREVADALTRLADTHRPRLVIVSGDVRAVQFLRQQVPGRVADLLHEVQGDYSDLHEALRRSAGLVAAAADADTADVLEVFRREQRSDGLAIAGPDATLAALHVGQVETLLLEAVAPDRTGWFGTSPAQAGATAAALRAAGVPDPQPASLGDVAVRAAIGTGAAVHVVPPGTPEVADSGLGALLRYR